MSQGLFHGARAFLNGYQLNGDLTALALADQREEVDMTTLAHDARHMEPGLRVHRLTMEGLWRDAVDRQLSTAFSAGEAALTVLARDQTVLRTGPCMAATYAPQEGAQPGQPARWSFEASLDGRSALAGDRLLDGAVSASAFSTPRHFGALVAGQSLVITTHVLGFAGTGAAITAVLQSAPSAAFSTPTDRATLTNGSVIGGNVQFLAEPVADPWYRVAYTVTGTAPAITLLIAAGRR